MPSPPVPWPKTVRILCRADFERVYKTGKRFGSPLFAAFAVPVKGATRIGFTTPRALGKSVVRNRLRRRLREVVRVRYPELAVGWELVFNPRRTLLTAEQAAIESEVGRFFASLGKRQ